MDGRQMRGGAIGSGVERELIKMPGTKSRAGRKPVLAVRAAC
jgi:hypothetical protein